MSVNYFHFNKITMKKYRQIIIFIDCLMSLINKNVKYIQLEVSSLNLRAQKFYKKLNFKYVSIRENYYSRDEHTLLYILEVKWLNGLDVKQIK